MVGKWVGMSSLPIEFLLWKLHLAIFVLLLSFAVLLAFLTFIGRACLVWWYPGVVFKVEETG